MTAHPSPDLETELSRFQSDVDIVRRFGESHPDEYADEFFENEPHIRLIVLIAGDNVAAHQSALHELVEHPNQFEVRATPYSRSRLDEIQREVLGVMVRRPGAIQQIGITRGRLHVRLSADQESLAATFHEQFGNAVVLHVGNFLYPPTGDEEDEVASSHAVDRAELPLLPNEFAVNLEGEILVSSGGTAGGALRFCNQSDTEIVIDTNGTLTARVLDPKTGEGVGGFSGAQTMPLVQFAAPPGGTVTIPVLVGTTSSVRSLGYAIPPGRYTIDVLIQIEGKAKFRTSPLPIEIGPPQQSP